MEGPWSIDVTCQNMVRVKVLSDELLKLFDNGHFNTGKRRWGDGSGDLLGIWEGVFMLIPEL